MRKVIFKDAYNNVVHPRKFYRDFPMFKELEDLHYFTFSVLAGQCERIEFIDNEGYVQCQITILNMG